MGSIVNATSLGKIGIGIGYSEEAIGAFLQITNYLEFLKSVDKGSYDTANFFVMSPRQLDEVLDRLGKLNHSQINVTPTQRQI